MSGRKTGIRREKIENGTNEYGRGSEYEVEKRKGIVMRKRRGSSYEKKKREPEEKKAYKRKMQEKN